MIQASKFRLQTCPDKFSMGQNQVCPMKPNHCKKTILSVVKRVDTPIWIYILVNFEIHQTNSHVCIIFETFWSIYNELLKMYIRSLQHNWHICTQHIFQSFYQRGPWLPWFLWLSNPVCGSDGKTKTYSSICIMKKGIL